MIGVPHASQDPLALGPGRLGGRSRRGRLGRALTLLLCIFLTACSSPAVKQTSPVILNWSPSSLAQTSALAWAKEAEKRLGTSDFTMIYCHGVTRDGEWWLSPDAPRKPLRVADVAWTLRNINTKPLVILACNEGAHTLDVPGTLYGRRIVWSTPDSGTALHPFRRKDWIGRIEDMEFTDRKVRLAGERSTQAN